VFALEHRAGIERQARLVHRTVVLALALDHPVTCKFRFKRHPALARQQAGSDVV